jgi:PAB1-binding protein PBP1
LNKEKFKVDSNYNENLYTTELNKENLTEDDIKRAEEIERVLLVKLFI